MRQIKVAPDMPIEDMLKSNKYWNVVDAIKIMGDTKNSEFVDKISEFISDDNPYIAFFAIEALGKIGSMDAVPNLKEFIAKNKDNSFLREYAGYTIDRIKESNGMLKHSFVEMVASALSKLIAQGTGFNQVGKRIFPKRKI